MSLFLFLFFISFFTEDNIIIMLPTYGDDHFGKEAGKETI